MENLKTVNQSVQFCDYHSCLKQCLCRQIQYEVHLFTLYVINRLIQENRLDWSRGLLKNGAKTKKGIIL